MIVGITKDIEAALAKKTTRRYLCEQEFAPFVVYYFSGLFTYETPGFHFGMYEDFRRLTEGNYSELAWIIFRESAKTSLAKIGIVWQLCYRKKRYINYDSYDKDNSEAALFDVAVQLQTNKKLIDDFGQLYNPESNRKGISKMKRLGNFITENEIKIEAFSTQEPTRGRVWIDKKQEAHRPDMYVLDDIETVKTRRSPVVQQSIKDHISELRAGLGPTGAVLYLGNLITAEGVISDVIERVKSSKTGCVRNVPVVMDGKIMWPDKYAFTDAEAATRNKTENRTK